MKTWWSIGWNSILLNELSPNCRHSQEPTSGEHKHDGRRGTFRDHIIHVIHGQRGNMEISKVMGISLLSIYVIFGFFMKSINISQPAIGIAPWWWTSQPCQLNDFLQLLVDLWLHKSMFESCYARKFGLWTGRLSSFVACTLNIFHLISHRPPNIPAAKALLQCGRTLW